MTSGPPISTAGPSNVQKAQSSANLQPAGHNAHYYSYPFPYHQLVGNFSPNQASAYNSAWSPYPYYAQPQQGRKVAPRPPSEPSPSFQGVPPYWDAALKSFLEKLGLRQALKGLEMDMTVMNESWEKKVVPSAVDDLVSALSASVKSHFSKTGDVEMSPPDQTDPTPKGLEDRKLDHVKLSTGKETRHPTSVAKEISRFLARNRARNDLSNGREFLYDKNERMKIAAEAGIDVSESDQMSTCARTDAKAVNRDEQMKYDIAKNEDGPLRRTMKKEKKDMENVDEGDLDTAQAGMKERFSNLETHLAVRYVPSPPRDMLGRLQLLEEHVVRVEKDYPPWAALHFNQPNRGWPPPPRSTPIIVPPHLRGAERSAKPDALPVDAGGVLPRNTKSSLQKAVIDRIHVKEALDDLRAPE